MTVLREDNGDQIQFQARTEERTLNEHNMARAMEKLTTGERTGYVGPQWENKK